MLTAGYRPNIGLALIIFVDAPMPASGKTLFSSALAIIATGYVPSPLALSSRSEENEKRLIAAARDAEPVLFVDNLSTALSGEFLASITTSEIAKIRPLGVSTTEQIRSRALVIVNGNNVQASLELERRVLRVRLDPQVPNPDERKHTFDMLDEVRRNRPQLVRDILTIVQAYEQAGRPGLPVPLGNFTEWNVLRGAVMWLGLPDPVKDRQSHFAASPEVMERVALFGLLYRVFSLEPFLTRDIEGRDEVRRALQLMLERNEWSSKSAGRLLKRHVDNLTHGLTLRSRMLSQGIQQWRLEGEPTKDLIEYIEGLSMDRM